MKYTAKKQIVIAADAGMGALTTICNVLTERRINIQDVYAAAEEQGKGMLHLIVDDTDAGEQAYGIVHVSRGYTPSSIRGLPSALNRRLSPSRAAESGPRAEQVGKFRRRIGRSGRTLSIKIPQ